jgi:aryl-alcohol dehydrogenase-like predicted oxidoreductase
MKYTTLGPDKFKVSSIGLGAMGMSDLYGHADEEQSIATIHRALDLGVNLIDTGDFYGMGHNEMLVGRAIKGRRDEAALTVKFGALRDPAGNWLGYETRTPYVKTFIAYSLKRLGVDYIDGYFPARVSPEIPIEETVGAVAEMIQAGYVRHIGLSEANVEQVRRAHAVHPISFVEIEYSLWTRDIEPELLPVLRELGIGVLAYSPLSRGFLTGTLRTPDDLAPNDWRRSAPRFQGENFAKNLQLVDRVRQIAERKGITPAQLALAWVLSKGEDIVPIVGTTKVQRLEENVASLDVKLTPEEIREIESAIPADAVAGSRYSAPGMAHVYQR